MKQKEKKGAFQIKGPPIKNNIRQIIIIRLKNKG